MTEEQYKFYFNSMYRLICYRHSNGIRFGELLDYAMSRKIDDEIFLSMLDGMEMDGLVTRRGETYIVALEKA